LSPSFNTFRKDRGGYAPILLIGLAVLLVGALGWVGLSVVGQSHRKPPPPPPETPQARFDRFLKLPPPGGMYRYWIDHTADRATRKETLPDRYAAYTQWLSTHPRAALRWWRDEVNGDARFVLGEAALDAHDYFLAHGQSLDGFTPPIAQRWWTRHVKATYDERWSSQGSIPPSTYTFDSAGVAAIGAISIRVASGRQLLVVTRSQTDTPYCGVVSPAAIGEGIGDAHTVSDCTVLWQSGP